MGIMVQLPACIKKSSLRIYAWALNFSYLSLVLTPTFSSSQIPAVTLGCLTTSFAHLSKLGALAESSLSRVSDKTPYFGRLYSRRTNDPVKTCSQH